jgi:hypothetical protein
MPENPLELPPLADLPSAGAVHPSRARTRIAQLTTAAAALALLAGCVHREQIGALSDGFVIAAGKDGGAVLDRPKPVDGAPLAAALAPGVGCIPDEQRLAKLGPVCSHETENKLDSQPASADLPMGKPEPTRQVSWYCDGRLVVRVVWEPCDGNKDGKLDGVSPVEVSVATHPAKD